MEKEKTNVKGNVLSDNYRLPLEAELSRVNEDIIENVDKYLEWGGMRTPIKLIFDMFTNLSHLIDDDEGEEKGTGDSGSFIFNCAWESLLLLKTLSELYELNERRRNLSERLGITKRDYELINKNDAV